MLQSSQIWEEESSLRSSYQKKNEVCAQEMFNFGSWSPEQHQKYIIFLDFLRKIMQSRQKRKQLRIFKVMAKIIETRTGVQCRSHHMKQLKAHKKLRNIIAHYQKNCDFPAYSEKFTEITQKMSHFEIKVRQDQSKTVHNISLPLESKQVKTNQKNAEEITCKAEQICHNYSQNKQITPQKSYLPFVAIYWFIPCYNYQNGHIQ